MKIICIGRNYVDHAKELNNPVPSQPLVFMKPATAQLKNGQDFYYPEWSENIHFELEVVLKISKNGKYIQKQFAENYYDEIGLGIDFTARDLQDKCKAKGHPWEIAKAFDHSAAVGEFISKDEVEVDNIDFLLKKNEEVMQHGNTKDLIFPFATLIEHVSKFFTLNKGDLIFTGTPAGVGPIAQGDRLEGYLSNKLLLSCNIK